MYLSDGQPLWITPFWSDGNPDNFHSWFSFMDEDGIQVFTRTGYWNDVAMDNDDIHPVCER